MSGKTQHQPITVVLGGGGLKGLAHIGALRVLEQRGLPVAGYVGTSIGSLVAALAATGRAQSEMEGLAAAITEKDILDLNRRIFWPLGIRQPAIFHGRALTNYLRELFPGIMMGDLAGIEFAVNAVRLETGEEVWITPETHPSMSLHAAVYASCALPMYFPPLEHEGSHLADGALTNVLGIDYATRWPRRILALDARTALKQADQGWLAKGLLGVHERMVMISECGRWEAQTEHWKQACWLYVRPDLSQFSTFGFEDTASIMLAGYDAVTSALEGAKIADTGMLGTALDKGRAWVDGAVRAAKPLVGLTGRN